MTARMALGFGLISTMIGCNQVPDPFATDPTGTTDPTVTTPTGTTDPVEPTVEVAADLPVLYLRVGESVELPFSVNRSSNLEGAVTATLTGLPEGVSAESLELAEGTLSGSFLITAAADASTGGPLPIVVRAEGEGAQPHEAEVGLIVAGQPGTFDESVGEGGSVTLEHPNAEADYGNDLVVDELGRILLVGVSETADLLSSTGWVVRLDGMIAPDPTFGDGGWVDDFGEGRSDALRIGLRGENDSLVLAADSSAGRTGFIIRALTEEGATDESYGPYGFTGFTEVRTDRTNGLHVTPAGEALAYGFTDIDPYDAQGVLDNSFVQYNAAIWRVSAARWDADGCVMTGGITFDADAYVVERLMPDGSLDEKWGESGTLAMPIPEGWGGRGYIEELRLFPDGSGVATASADLFGGDNRYPAVMRFDASGQPDPAFGGTGLIPLLDEGGIGTVSALEVHDGKVLVAAYEIVEDVGWVTTLRRFGADGLPDPTFGGSGVLELSERVWAMAIDEPGGRVITMADDPDGGVLLTRIWL